MKDPLVCLFLLEAAHHLKVAHTHGNKLVRLGAQEEALISLRNAKCCRRLTKADKLEILGIQTMIEDSNNA